VRSVVITVVIVVRYQGHSHHFVVIPGNGLGGVGGAGGLSGNARSYNSALMNLPSEDCGHDRHHQCRRHVLIFVIIVVVVLRYHGHSHHFVVIPDEAFEEITLPYINIIIITTLIIPPPLT
jgi:hypothetical protein